MHSYINLSQKIESFKKANKIKTSQPPQMTANSASKYFGITEKQVKSIDLWLLQSQAGRDHDIEAGIPLMSAKLQLSHSETRILLQNRLNTANSFRKTNKVLKMIVIIALGVAIWQFTK